MIVLVIHETGFDLYTALFCTLDSLPAKFMASQRKIEVRQSDVHGRGVFAVKSLKKGARVIEYKGEIISWREALRRHPHDPDHPTHTFYFSLEDGRCIDGGVKGNNARWINHACAPNCEAREEGEHVYIYTKREIEPGEELFYDYGLVIDARYTAKLKREYACHCGSKQCRGTLLAPKR